MAKGKSDSLAKIGIISDSHDHIENINKAVSVFREKKLDFIIHLGDYVNPLSIKPFQGLRIKGVFGNNDGDKFRLVRVFNEIKGELLGDFGEIEYNGLKFALYHGTDSEIKDALVKCGKYDVVFFGHTHVVEYKKYGKTISINPGTCHGFLKRATIGIFEASSLSLEIIDL